MISHSFFLFLFLIKEYHKRAMYNQKCNEMSASCHERPILFIFNVFLDTIFNFQTQETPFLFLK
ncbi:hypothetical protein BOQ23_13800 [Listeria monocytogenes]|nr:hypothetical protein [Listeria monocytogenes]